MTGEEYLSLKVGSIVSVETPFNGHKIGQVLVVEYIGGMQLIIYLREPCKPLGSQIDIVPLKLLLDNCIIGGKLPEKSNKVLELPFKVGDKAWLIIKDEVQEVKIIKCNISIDINEGTLMYYDALYTSKLCFDAKVSHIASYRLYKTKEELLKSL